MIGHKNPTKKVRLKTFKVLILLTLFQSSSLSSYGFQGLNESGIERKVDSLLNECRRVSRKPDSLALLGFKLLRLGVKHKHERSSIEGYFALGFSNYNKGNYREAKLYYDSAIEIQSRDEKKYYRSLKRVVRNRGILYRNTGEGDKSALDFSYLLRLAADYNDYLGQAYAYNELGILSKNKNQHNGAINYYEKAILILDSLENPRLVFGFSGDFQR
ncbi:MAG: tetratricopeptide repeat protein [Bacteroidota bacterium]